MKPRASFAFGSLNFTINQDGEVARQDNLMDTSSSNQVRDKIPDELPEVGLSLEGLNEDVVAKQQEGLELPPERLDEDVVAKPQEELGKDSLHHLIPTSPCEGLESSGQP
jgi:hypothetical protein